MTNTANRSPYAALAERLPEIRKRCEAATPGPWRIRQWGWGGENPEPPEWSIDGPRGHRITAEDVYPGDGRDVYFIAHAREDIPFLLDAIRALEQQNEKLEAAAREGWCPFEEENLDLKNRNDELEAQRTAVLSQNEEMRALLIHIEPRCEYVGCEKPGPHCTHSVGGVASASPTPPTKEHTYSIKSEIERLTYESDYEYALRCEAVRKSRET